MSDALNAPLSVDERAELERLRAEVAQRPPRRRSSGWVRSTASVLLIALGCLMGPPAVVALWAHGVVGDTDRYVETVAPLAKDPAVQAAVTDKITNEIFRRLDVETLTTRAVDALGNQLPPDVATQLSGLSGPISNGIRSTTNSQVAKIVASDTFAQAWTEANRAAHTALVSALSGKETGTLKVQNGTVSVDLSTFADAVKQRLSARGFALADRIPPINAEFVILKSNNLERYQSWYSVLAKLGFWLGPIAGVIIGLGVYVARNHRRAFIGAGLGLAFAMLISGILLLIAREAYLNAVPPSVLPGAAAASLFDTGIRFLREVIRAVGLLALVFAAGAFLTGPSLTATRIRGAVVRLAEKCSDGLESLGLHMGGVGRSVRARASLWRVALVILAFAGFVIPTYPTPTLVFWLTVSLLVALFVLQILASGGRDRRVVGDRESTLLPPAPPPVASPASPVTAAGTGG